MSKTENESLMDTNKMREQFEAWECDAPQGPQTDPMWLIYDAESNAYGLDKIQDRWEVWQASRAAVVVELPDKSGEGCGSYSTEPFEHYGDGWDECRENAVALIEAQGLKVKP